jgi:hypothetical protein
VHVCENRHDILVIEAVVIVMMPSLRFGSAIITAYISSSLYCYDRDIIEQRATTRSKVMKLATEEG